MKFKPNRYYKDIFNINYDKLKEEGIKTLIFDLDNTLDYVSKEGCNKKTKKLVRELKKDFLVLICSNNYKKRISLYLDEFGIDGVSFSMKPLPVGLNKLFNKYNLNKDETAIIGDQMVTDVLAGNLYNINTILVDPLGKKDLKITHFNRVLEKLIRKRYLKLGVFERGKYYE